MFNFNNHKALEEPSAALALRERVEESLNENPAEHLLAEPTKVPAAAFEGTVVVPPSCAADVALRVAWILGTDRHVKVLTSHGSNRGTTFNCSVADQATVVDVTLQMPHGTSWDFGLVSPS